MSLEKNYPSTGAASLRGVVLRILFVAFCVIPVAAAVAAQETEVFAEVAKFTATDGELGDGFGSSISLDGERVATGAFGASDSGVDSGSAYIFERDENGIWMEAAKLTPLEGEPVFRLGTSISLDGDRVAIGTDGIEPGYIFERDASGLWSQVASLSALDGDLKVFGTALSLDGDLVVIGDPGQDFSAGAAYVFARDANEDWVQAVRLTASDGVGGSEFGTAVALDGSRAAVSATEAMVSSGSVYIFEQDADQNWLETAGFFASDGAEGEEFGSSVALEGDRVAVGAAEATGGDGAAYIFERDADGSWSEVAKLSASGGEAGEKFGKTIALAGDRVAVGATGRAYLFERNADGDWVQLERLTTLDATEGFGSSAISLDGVRVAVGARQNFVAGNGAAYMFESVVVAPQFGVAGTCPGEIVMASRGFTPRDFIGLYRAEAIGQSVVGAGPCVGTELGLDDAVPLRLWATDFDAIGSIIRTVQASQCGDYLQVVDARTCLVTDVVRIPLAAP